jgi:hypothetical protein
MSRSCPEVPDAIARQTAPRCRPVGTISWPPVRAIFTIYLVFVVVGIAYFTTIGLAHH